MVFTFFMGKKGLFIASPQIQPVPHIFYVDWKFWVAPKELPPKLQTRF